MVTPTCEEDTECTGGFRCGVRGCYRDCQATGNARCATADCDETTCTCE